MVAVTNIELYEALKKSLNEDAARMIAEVVPVAGEVATRGDLALLKSDLALLKSDLAVLKSDLMAHIDSKLLRYTFAFFVPMWLTTAGLFATLITKL